MFFREGKNGDGMFKRMCSLHKQFPSFEKITVAFFGSIGTELKELREKKETAEGEETTKKKRGRKKAAEEVTEPVEEPAATENNE